MSPRISVFHARSDAWLGCVLARVSDRDKIVVSSLDGILPALALRGIATQGLVLDLIGHGHERLLRFGPDPVEDVIDERQRFITIFKAFTGAGIQQVRLLGCSIGDTDPAAARLKKLAQDSGMTIKPSVVVLTSAAYCHAGLRPKAESSVFNVGPNPAVKDPPFLLTSFLEQNPTPRGSGRLVGRQQVSALERLLETDYLCCCLQEEHLDSAPTIKAFEMEMPRGVGRGRVVDRNGELFVLAAKGNLEVIYRPQEGVQQQDIRAIIDLW